MNDLGSKSALTRDKGDIMTRSGVICALVACLALLGVANVAAQKPDTVLDLLLAAIDDTSCGDGIGRTYRGESLIAATEQDDIDAFFARHGSCAGLSGATAALGKTPLPVGLTGRCSAATEVPGLQYEWVICVLGFTSKNALITPIHIDLDEFVLITNDDQKLAAYLNPEFYKGQWNDKSSGIDFVGPDAVFATIAFAAFAGQVEAPFVIRWETTGDAIIADELDPMVAEAFIRDTQMFQ
jgi:hypothetical protein